jgi:hypothetical protein
MIPDRNKGPSPFTSRDVFGDKGHDETGRRNEIIDTEIRIEAESS